MRKKWRYNSLNFNHKIKKQDGFTLLEVLVTLSVSSLCFLLLSFGITQARSIQEEVKDDKQIEWHLFLNQLEYYLQESELVSVSRDQLIVRELDGETGGYDTASYRRPTSNRSVLIRSVRNGNQRVLSEVYWVRFEREEELLEIEGYFRNGDIYNAQLNIERWEREE